MCSQLEIAWCVEKEVYSYPDSGCRCECRQAADVGVRVFFNDHFWGPGGRCGTSCRAGAVRCVCAQPERNGDGVKISSAGTGACEGQACRLREQGSGLSHTGGVKASGQAKQKSLGTGLGPCSPRARRSAAQSESSRFGASVLLSSEAPVNSTTLQTWLVFSDFVLAGREEKDRVKL